MPEKISELKSNCKTCKREQFQQILASIKVPFSDDLKGWDGEDWWEILKCGGCGTVSFRSVFWFSENYDERGRAYPTIKCYPATAALEERPFQNVPRKIREVYHEVVETFTHQAFVLCAAGLRAVIEGICSEEKIRTGPVKVKTKAGVKTVRKKDLRGKIEGLLERGVITKSHRDTLHQHRYLGNEAVHELEPPHSTELSVAIKIVEHTLEHIYELPKSAEMMLALSKKRKHARRRLPKGKRLLPPPPSLATPPISAVP